MKVFVTLPAKFPGKIERPLLTLRDIFYDLNAYYTANYLHTRLTISQQTVSQYFSLIKDVSAPSV